MRSYKGLCHLPSRPLEHHCNSQMWNSSSMMWHRYMMVCAFFVPGGRSLSYLCNLSCIVLLSYCSCNELYFARCVYAVEKIPIRDFANPERFAVRSHSHGCGCGQGQ